MDDMKAAAPAPAGETGLDCRLYGPLFVDVQMQGIFADGKTFVDAVPRSLSPPALRDLYLSERDRPGFSLIRFVRENFRLPPDPATVIAAPARPNVEISEHIRQLWPQLVRSSPVADGTLLPLPNAYVVPGGRFREIYYWDSFFTILGLMEQGLTSLAEGMIGNFAALIDSYGYMPNGNRSYFLSRSQPPFFFKMVECVHAADPAAGFSAYLPQLLREHAYWMDGEDGLAEGEAHAHLVRLGDGALLNRFWDARDEPREESYRDDVRTASHASRAAGEVYRDLRAAAESGWDFSSRWCAEPSRLDTIETTSLLPVDLNAILWGLERAIAAGAGHAGAPEIASAYQARAKARAEAIDRYLWSDTLGYYVDYHWRDETQRQNLTAASLAPLYFGVAGEEQARAVAEATADKLLHANGVVTTLVQSGQQWDWPNGWAPLQWIAAEGLRRYGHDALAGEITRRWLAMVERIYRETGKLLEKYDAIENRAGGGGEYPTQDGFGWTNGTFAALARRYRAGTPVP